MGFKVLARSEHKGLLQFADGSYQDTVGQVRTSWKFESGKRIPITFEVLKDSCSDLIIGEEILWDNNVFELHESSIISASEEFEQYYLAPFAYLKTWQKRIFKRESNHKSR